MHQNPISQLTLIAYDSSRFDRQFPPKHPDWFFAEGCARHVYITTEKNPKINTYILNDITVTQQETTSFVGNPLASRVITGVDAYTYL